MQKPDHHFIVCNSFRTTGEPKGICNRKGAADLLQYLENEIVDRGINGMITSAGCLKVCESGPVMVLHPQGRWYGHVDESRIDEILDAVEEGDPLPSDLALD
jgi:(2Fe-2S) ferredoxin